MAVVNLIRGAAESSAPTVLAADRDGAHEATRHLLELGHRHRGYLGGPSDTNSGQERFAGYERALRERRASAGPARGAFAAWAALAGAR